MDAVTSGSSLGANNTSTAAPTAVANTAATRAINNAAMGQRSQARRAAIFAPRISCGASVVTRRSGQLSVSRSRAMTVAAATVVMRLTPHVAKLCRLHNPTIKVRPPTTANAPGELSLSAAGNRLSPHTAVQHRGRNKNGMKIHRQRPDRFCHMAVSRRKMGCALVAQRGKFTLEIVARPYFDGQWN